VGHQHTAQTEIEQPFFYCVAGPDGCNPAAHGGVILRQRCACGAIREVASNGGHVERGAWREREHVPVLDRRAHALDGWADAERELLSAAERGEDIRGAYVIVEAGRVVGVGGWLPGGVS